MPSDKRSAEFELLARLRHSTPLRTLGCDAIRGLSGSVCLTVAGKSIGTWWYEDGEFRFAQVADRPPSIEVPTAEEAISKSVELAMRQVVAVGEVA